MEQRKLIWSRTIKRTAHLILIFCYLVSVSHTSTNDLPLINDSGKKLELSKVIQTLSRLLVLKHEEKIIEKKVKTSEQIYRITQFLKKRIKEAEILEQETIVQAMKNDLFPCIKNGDFTSFSSLLGVIAEVINPDMRNLKGWLDPQKTFPLLNHALYCKKHEFVKPLLTFGCSPLSYDKNGKLPIHYAAQDGNLETIKILLEHSRNIYPYRNDLVTKNIAKETPLSLAIKNNNLDAVICFVEDDPSQLVRSKKSLLSKEDSTAINKFLVKELTKIAVTAKLFGNNQLSKKAQEMGAVLPQIDTSMSDEDTAKKLIEHAVSFMGKDEIKPFFNGMRDKNDQPYIHYLVRMKKNRLLSILLSYPIDLSLEDNSYEETALHYAIRFNNHEAVKLLVEKGSPLWTRNAAKETPLDLAINKGQLNNVTYLVNEDEDHLLDDKAFILPKEEPFSKNQEICLTFLKKRLNARYISALTLHGNLTEAMRAKKNRDLIPATDLRINHSSSNLLEIELSCKLRHQLIKAIEADNLEAFLEVKKRGASTSKESELQLAIKANSLNIIKFIVKDDENVSKKEFFFAAEYGSPEAFNLFWENKTLKAKLITDEGESLLDFALKNNNDKMACSIISEYPFLATEKKVIEKIIEKDSVMLFSYLLDKNPDFLQGTDSEKNTILHRIAIAESVNIARFMQERHPKVLFILGHEKNNLDKTAFQLIITKLEKATITNVEKLLKLAEALFRSQKDPLLTLNNHTLISNLEYSMSSEFNGSFNDSENENNQNKKRCPNKKKIKKLKKATISYLISQIKKTNFLKLTKEKIEKEKEKIESLVKIFLLKKLSPLKIRSDGKQSSVCPNNIFSSEELKMVVNKKVASRLHNEYATKLIQRVKVLTKALAANKKLALGILNNEPSNVEKALKKGANPDIFIRPNNVFEKAMYGQAFHNAWNSRPIQELLFKYNVLPFFSGGEQCEFDHLVMEHLPPKLTRADKENCSFILNHSDNSYLNTPNSEGNSILLAYCKKYGKETDPEVVSLLISYGADPKINDPKNRSCLMYCPATMVAFFIEKGLNPNQKALDGSTPLTKAVSEIDTKKVRELIRLGPPIDQNQRDELINCSISELSVKLVEFFLQRKIAFPQDQALLEKSLDNAISEDGTKRLDWLCYMLDNNIRFDANKLLTQAIDKKSFRAFKLIMKHLQCSTTQPYLEKHFKDLLTITQTEDHYSVKKSGRCWACWAHLIKYFGSITSKIIGPETYEQLICNIITYYLTEETPLEEACWYLTNRVFDSDNDDQSSSNRASNILKTFLKKEKNIKHLKNIPLFCHLLEQLEEPSLLFEDKKLDRKSLINQLIDIDKLTPRLLDALSKHSLDPTELFTKYEIRQDLFDKFNIFLTKNPNPKQFEEKMSVYFKLAENYLRSIPWNNIMTLLIACEAYSELESVIKIMIKHANAKELQQILLQLINPVSPCYKDKCLNSFTYLLAHCSPQDQHCISEITDAKNETLLDHCLKKGEEGIPYVKYMLENGLFDLAWITKILDENNREAYKILSQCILCRGAQETLVKNAQAEQITWNKLKTAAHLKDATLFEWLMKYEKSPIPSTQTFEENQNTKLNLTEIKVPTQLEQTSSNQNLLPKSSTIPPTTLTSGENINPVLPTQTFEENQNTKLTLTEIRVPTQLEQTSSNQNLLPKSSTIPPTTLTSGENINPVLPTQTFEENQNTNLTLTEIKVPTQLEQASSNGNPKELNLIKYQTLLAFFYKNWKPLAATVTCSLTASIAFAFFFFSLQKATLGMNIPKIAFHPAPIINSTTPPMILKNSNLIGNYTNSIG